MRDLYSDDYESIAGNAEPRLIPDRARRIAGAVVFVGLVAAMGLWSWRLGTRDATEVPIVRAMAGPTRVVPADPGGAVAANQGLEVNGVLAGTKAPAPRAKAASEKPVLAEEDAAQAVLVVPPPPDFAAASGQAQVEVPVSAEEETAVAALPDAAAATSIQALVAEAQGEVRDDGVAAGDAVAGPRPMVRPVNLPRPVATATAVATPAVARPAADRAAAAPAQGTAAPAAGTRVVQLGAYDSEAITRSAWARLVANNRDLLGSKSLYVERATSNARVFYRLRVAGFSSAEETRVMCESLRARGIDCIPVQMQ